MEKILDAAEPAIQNMLKAAEQYRAILPDFQELIKYYESPAWMKDYDDREQQKLPADLKCGVLSEDGIYNLLLDQKELTQLLREIVKKG